MPVGPSMTAKINNPYPKISLFSILHAPIKDEVQAIDV